MRLGHRLPWLLVGLVGAMGSAGLVASFEATLREELLLAVFMLVWLAFGPLATRKLRRR